LENAYGNGPNEQYIDLNYQATADRLGYFSRSFHNAKAATAII